MSSSGSKTVREVDLKHEFGAVNTVLFCAMLGLCVTVGYLLKRYKFYYLPESAAVILLGAIMGSITSAINPNPEEMSFLKFQPEVFFFVLLPPIIFEAGYTLNKKGFFSNFTTILMFAVVGTLVSTFIVGLFMYAIAAGGIIELQNHSPLEALLFGALISAVDPVATLAIMGAKEINCDPLLYSLIFGESVLNDAVAIVLFRTIQGMLPTSPGAATPAFDFGTVMSVLGQFFYVSVGSVAVGILCGLLCSLLFRKTKLPEYPKYEITTLIITAFGSYAVAEAITMSGIMALFFTGITLSHYNFYNLSKDSQTSSTYVFEAVASLSETIVFAYLGTTIFSAKHKYDILMVIFALFACLLGRALNTFPLSWLANLKRKVKIPMNMQIVIWFAGLRGAVAFALALTLTTPNAQYITTTTLCIVLFTTFVCGGLTEPLLGRMGMKRSARRGSSGDVTHSLLGVGDEASSGAMSVPLPKSRARGGFHGWFKNIDTKYLKPIFGGERVGTKREPGLRGVNFSDEGNVFDDRRTQLKTIQRNNADTRGPPYDPPLSPANKSPEETIDDSAI